jgi:hypothetical protein
LTRRSHTLTTVAIAITAYALCDLVHEVVGHGTAAFLMPGVRVLSLSSVALQTTGSSRIVAAAGSIANLIVGSAALAFFCARDRFSAIVYFLWLFGSLNLLNGSGYLLYSAALGYGDWQVVVADLQHAWMWRAALGIAGAAAYAGVVLLSANVLARAVRTKQVSRTEIPRLVFPAYVTGDVLLVLAAAFNPIGPSLILLSGVSSGSGAMAGLMFVPRLIEHRTARHDTGTGCLPPASAWIVIGLVVGVAFVAIVGPGIRF